MRWLPIALVACSSRAPRQPPKPPPPEAPREVFSAYHVGSMRIEGAPPIERGSVKPFDAPDQVGRLFGIEIKRDGSPSFLVGGAGDCYLVSMWSMRWSAGALCNSHHVSWAKHADAALAFTTEAPDDTSQLYLNYMQARRKNEPTSMSSGRIASPLLDAKRSRVFFGFSTTTESPNELQVIGDKQPATENDLHGSGGKPPTTVNRDGPWSPLDVSADGRFVVSRRDVSTRDAALYLIEVATGKAVALTEPATAAGAAMFTRTGDLIAVTEDGDRQQLFRYTGRARIPVSIPGRGDVDEVAVVNDTILFTVVDNGLSTLWMADDMPARPVIGVPEDGVISDLHATGSTVAFSFVSPTRPKHLEIYTLDGQRLRQTGRWPNNPAPSARPTELHEATAADGITFQILLTRPFTEQRVPVVVEFHSGPEDRWLPKYDAFAQFLVAQGHAVVRPNIRGSTGQGRTFEGLDNGMHRADTLRDIAATLDWIAKQPQLDARRVAVAGTSYGGYLALAAVRAFPDRVRGAATLGAITDFVGFLEGTAAYRRDHRRAEYGDEREPAMRDFLTKISPLAHVAELRRPLLMAYGLKDPRVPPATADRFIRAARAAGVRVWSAAAADEGHWFEQADNRRVFEILLVQFLRSLEQ